MAHARSKAAEGLGLSTVQSIGILAIVVVIFLFAEGPIWRRTWSPDANILWSYAPIPILVALCQGWNGSLRLRRWLVATFVLCAVKYLVTAVIFLTILAASGTPPVHGTAAGRSPVEAVAGVRRPATPAFPSTAPRGTLAGRVVGSDGAPIAAAAVYVADRFDGWTFGEKAPDGAWSIGNGAIGPLTACLRRGDGLRVRAVDGLLHTLHGLTSGGQYLFNASIVGERTVQPSGSADRVKLRCAVHASESAEIVILPHPFFASTSQAGDFSISGIPEGKRAIAVWRPGAAVAHGTTEVAPSLTKPAVLTVRGEAIDVRRD